MKLRCSHCRSLGTIKTAQALSSTVTRHYVACSNLECGHTWRATTEADLTISPSATPDPSVLLPISSHMRRDLVGAQMRTNNVLEHVPLFTPSSTRDLFDSPPGPS
jgi:Ogr/Delta-like zinc finger